MYVGTNRAGNRHKLEKDGREVGSGNNCVCWEY
jgi:hypothetical protein